MPQIRIASLLTVLALVPALCPGQATIYVPDASSSTGAACNVIPFGSGTFAVGYSYLARIPASFLNPAATKLQDISFAPCQTLGSWSSATVLVQMGHVPNPLPATFNFPVGANLGSFLDLTTVWDSAVQGPLTWTMTPNVWSPLGLSTAAGTPFCWDGTNDIAFYITFLSATVVGGGGCHRTATEPYRIYAAGYQAPVGTGFGPNGEKMKLDFIPCGPPLWQLSSPASSLDVNGIQATIYTPALLLLPVNSTATANFASSNLGFGWEVVLSGNAIVPNGGGAVITPNGQFFHLDFTYPMIFLNGGLFPLLVPYPGNFSVPFGTGPSPAVISAQQLVIEPPHPDGFVLSQAPQVTVQ